MVLLAQMINTIMLEKLDKYHHAYLVIINHQATCFKLKIIVTASHLQ